ncbi:MAG: sugar transferase [Aquabacterium sp.]
MIKRLFDIATAAAGLVLLLPVLLAVALAIRIDSPGPVFFRQVRIGRHGRPFRIFKFRTMTVAGEPRGGAQITVAGDARITRVGGVLRSWKLDELPQLIDVLRGTMSLVGPRPEVPRYVDAYPEEQREHVLSVRPGITDLASLRYRDESAVLAQAVDPEREYVDVILPEKLRAAQRYVDHASLGADLRILGLTLSTVFAPAQPARTMRAIMGNAALWAWIDRWMHGDRRRHLAWAWAVDGLAVLATWHITYLFRLGFERWQPGRPWYDDWVSLGVALTYLLAIQGFGARRSLWRWFAFEDFRRLAMACMAAGLVCAAAVQLAQLVGVARAVLVLHPFFALFALAGIRMLNRMLAEHAEAVVQGEGGDSRQVIVVGGGNVGRRLVAGLHRRYGWRVMMVLDDDVRLHGARIGGVRVEGGLERLRDPVLTLGATHVILALDDDRDPRVPAVIAAAREAGLVVLSVPDPAGLAVVA